MSTTRIFWILLVTVMTRCGSSESRNGYHHDNGNVASEIGDLLKPPPLPLSPIVPVPFHGGVGRSQRQNLDVGYQYQEPLLPPASSIAPQIAIPPNGDFKFPAPFYKQYNFNFVPPPQPFTTTPSPSLFQKVSGWLFPSKEISYEGGSLGENNMPPLKKDCNPCNLVPWIPVIRYKVGSENLQQNIHPTYGPPSPTTYSNAHNNNLYNLQNLSPKYPEQTYSTGVPHEIYGPPRQSAPHLHTFKSPSSTYGPPSPTHTLPILQDNSIRSTYSFSSNSYDPSSLFRTSSSPFGRPSSTYGVPNSFNGISSSTFQPHTPEYVTYPTPYDNSRFLSTTTSPPDYYPEAIEKELPSIKTDVEILNGITPATDLQLPKVSPPVGFKNSYGEIITNSYALDIPYPVSATAAESNRVKTEVLPYDHTKMSTPNTSVVLANPAPFTANRGRNIHTLQPVALPNLSVSPLPPIFNARPFRPISTQFPTNFVKGINLMQQTSNNIDVAKSVSIAEYTHSVEYPTSIIQSPIIDIDSSRILNQTKAYRNIPNSFVIDDIKDISPQASEDHISAAKSQKDASFESTGADFGNDLYELGLPLGFGHIPSNHKPDFADLRGIKDEDVDKYRTESNLQNIDSPLLYLKPSAPHKDFENFVTISTPGNDHEYEIYDDVPTTTSSPQQSTLTSAWDESRTYYSDLSPPVTDQDNEHNAKIIQIIVPYTTGEQIKKDNIESWPSNWKLNSEEDYLARKVQSNTENYNFITSTTESYSATGTTTEEPVTTATEENDAARLNTPAMLNDLYDVKEPPFDIIKLQRNIDDWTEQEYSKHFKDPQKTRSNEKYAKQIPDDFFTTTINPIANYVTASNKYNYDFYDHEGSSSIQHTVTDTKNSNLTILRKDYNAIERTKTSHNSDKNQDLDEIQKLHIYTAASSFRTSTTTTPAPWSEIQTSISPLTKEKVYVVTSKPWKEKPKAPEYDYDVGSFESKKTIDTTSIGSDDLPFNSPRFSHRPSFGFSTTGTEDHFHLETSKEWHHSINNLGRVNNENIFLLESSELKDNTNMEEGIPTPKIAVP